MTHSLQALSGQMTSFSGGSPLFGNTSDNIYVRIADGESSTINLGPIQGLDIQWGLWSSVAATPSFWQTLDGTTEGQLNQLLMVAAPVSTSTIRNKLRGDITFGSTSAFLADRNASGPDVQAITGSFTLDVDDGLINDGELRLCLGTADCTAINTPWELWDVDFSGSLSDGRFNNSSISGNIAVHDGIAAGVTEGGNLFEVENRYISGTMNGLLTGQSAEGFVLGFKLFEVDNTTNSIIGSSIFKAPVAITATEISALQRDGFAVVARNPLAQNLGLHFGQAPDLFIEGGHGDALLYSNSPGFVLRESGVAGTQETHETDYEFSWGRWTGTAGEPLRYHPFLNNRGIYNELSGEVIVVSLTPSSHSALSAFTGTARFDVSSTYLLTGPDKEEGVLTGKFTVNFDTGVLSDGLLTLQVSSETWTSSSFSGTLADGLLAPLNISGTVTNMMSSTSNAFTGSFGGRFTGESTLGFLAGFDFIETGGSLVRSGAALYVPSTAGPVLTESDSLDSDKFGFVLAGTGYDASYTPLTAYGRVEVNDGDGNPYLGGVTETLVSSDLSDPLALDLTPEYIFRRRDALVESRQTGVDESSVNWGKWNGSSDNFRIYTQYDDDSEYLDKSNQLLFVNFVPTSASEWTSIGNITRTYIGSDPYTYGQVSHFLEQGTLALHGIRSAFDIDFGSGEILNGIMSLCVSGTSCGSGSQDWELRFTGSFTDGILTDFEAYDTRVDEVNSALTVQLLGGFTGNDAQAFVGGLHVYRDGFPGDYVRAAYILRNGSYLTADEIIGLNMGDYGMLATAGDFAGVYGGRAIRRGTSFNYVLTDNALTSDTWYNDNSFHNDEPQQVLRKGGAAQTVEINVAGLGLSWGKWDADSGAPITRDSYTSTDGTLEQDAYWFVGVPSAPTPQGGYYASFSSVLAAQGGSSEGGINSGNIGTLGFVLNLGTGVISNGQLKIFTGQDTWKVFFDGDARSNTGLFGPFLSLNMTSASVRVDDENYESSNISGNITGMLINHGNNAVTSFAFRNDDSIASGQHVAGTALLGKEDLAGWGSWNATLVSNWSTQLVSDTQSLFSSLQLTPDFVLANMQGVYRFSSAMGHAQGSGASAGTLSAIEAQLDVDFATGMVENGYVQATVGTNPQVWRAEFEGEYGDGVLILNQQALKINDVVNSGTADLNGRFTGASASGFIGVFNMQDGADANNAISGGFTLSNRQDITPQ